jgi:hypothetical protein
MLALCYISKSLCYKAMFVTFVTLGQFLSDILQKETFVCIFAHRAIVTIVQHIHLLRQVCYTSELNVNGSA